MRLAAETPYCCCCCCSLDNVGTAYHHLNTASKTKISDLKISQLCSHYFLERKMSWNAKG